MTDINDARNVGRSSGKHSPPSKSTEPWSPRKPAKPLKAASRNLQRKFARRGELSRHAAPVSQGKHDLWPLHRLKPAERNARTHNKTQLQKLTSLIAKVGFIDPIVVDETGKILSGHLRFHAAKDLNMTQVPVVQMDNLTAAQKRIYALAANRIALDAGWDREMLAAELGELAIELQDTDYEIADTGFELAEIDAFARDFGDAGAEAPDDAIPEKQEPVSRLGDVFNLGKHRLFVGDARHSGSYRRLMSGATAQTIFTDPPYNVSITRHARRRSAHSEFVMASGEMSEAEFARFLDAALLQMGRVLVDGGIAYICIDWRHVSVLERAGLKVFAELKNVCVWVKSNAGMGTFYRSQHEFVLVFKKGAAAHINTFELGQHGRSRTNVWEYAGVNAFKSGRSEELALHATPKPVALVADAILDCSRRGDIVLDPFLGSGTTLIAAEKVGRCAYGMELDPAYADVAIRRWQAYTGRDAVLERTSETYNEVAARAASSDENEAAHGEA